MPKVMRSKKEGSKCADCGLEIKMDDPIAYFGPRFVYGLTCHRSEKAERYLKQLLQEEASLSTTPPPTPIQGPAPHPRLLEASALLQEWRNGVIDSDTIGLNDRKVLMKLCELLEITPHDNLSRSDEPTGSD